MIKSKCWASTITSAQTFCYYCRCLYSKSAQALFFGAYNFLNLPVLYTIYIMALQLFYKNLTGVFTICKLWYNKLEWWIFIWKLIYSRQVRQLSHMILILLSINNCFPTNFTLNFVPLVPPPFGSTPVIISK